jgi:hypothetical protein
MNDGYGCMLLLPHDACANLNSFVPFLSSRGVSFEAVSTFKGKETCNM